MNVFFLLLKDLFFCILMSYDKLLGKVQTWHDLFQELLKSSMSHSIIDTVFNRTFNLCCLFANLNECTVKPVLSDHPFMSHGNRYCYVVAYC